nr:SulP family inorganic anion transporter [Haloglycomyces albus]
MKPVTTQRRFTLPKPFIPFIRTELLAGLLVAVALIPETIAFSIIAGVDPSVGLFSPIIMTVSIAFLGGRPAMISAATGAMALVVAPLVASHGVGHMIAATLLAGIIQIILALTGIAKVMRYIPRSVFVGFIKTPWQSSSSSPKSHTSKANPGQSGPSPPAPSPLSDYSH